MSAISPEQTREYLAFAREVAREAGALTLEYFRTEFTVDTKADATPVTIADRESEGLIRRRIGERFPDHGILGEEEGASPGTADLTWIIDPIDGTRSFVHGVPLYAVLIALVDGRWDGSSECDSSRVVVGVVYVPPLDEMVCAGRALGCEWEVSGAVRPARVSPSATLSAAWITTSDFADLARRAPGVHERIVDSRANTRTWGDGYGYLLVATGRCEAMIDPIVSPWDIAPMPVIMEEAGGAFSDIHGRGVLGRSAVASNGRVHEMITALPH